MSEWKEELKRKLISFAAITIGTIIGLFLAPRLADFLVPILFNDGLMYYEESKFFATCVIVGVWLIMSINIIIEKQGVEKEAKV